MGDRGGCGNPSQGADRGRHGGLPSAYGWVLRLTVDRWADSASREDWISATLTLVSVSFVSTPSPLPPASCQVSGVADVSRRPQAGREAPVTGRVQGAGISVRHHDLPAGDHHPIPVPLVSKLVVAP
jgi:hypothetical protein